MRLWLCVAASLLFMPAALADWDEVRTENFTVRGDASDATLREFARELEQFRIFLGIVYANRLPPPEPVNVPVYIMASGSSFEKIYGGEGAAGVFTSRINSPIFVGNAARDASQSMVRGQRRDTARTAQQIIKHEYIHHFVYINGPAYYPMWYSEGIADFYSTFEYDDGTAQVGTLISHRGSWLIYGDLLDWEDVFSSNRSWRKPGGRSLDGEDVALYYAQSWIAVHYFMSDPERRQQMNTYLASLYEGLNNYEEKFKAAFGKSMKEVGQDVERYLDSNQLSVQHYNLSDYEVTPSLEENNLDNWEADFALVYAQRFFARNDEAREEIASALEELLAGRPDSVDALVELAYLRLDQDDKESALPLIEKAYELAPGNDHVLVLKGLTAPHSEVRSWYDKARKADPTNALAQYQYAHTYRGSATEDALDAAIQAMRASANRDRVPLLVGELLVELGYTDDARTILQPIATWEGNNGYREQARRLLDRID